MVSLHFRRESKPLARELQGSSLNLTLWKFLWKLEVL